MSAVQLLLPELLLGAIAFGVLGLDLVLPRDRRPRLFWLGVVGVVGVGISLLTQVGQRGVLSNRLFVLDGYTLFFHALFLAIAAVVLLFSAGYVRRFLSYPGEFVALILLSTLGMMFIAAAGELLTAYISLELLSFCLYILASYARDDPKSNEAGLKYVLLGALATALLLLGVSLVYGYAGSTFYREIAVALSGRDLPPGVWMGLALLLAGLGFKVAAVPFHGWAPDVYEGAPLPVTAYISSASKAAGFAFLLRLGAEALQPALPQLMPALAAIAAVTMTLGNLVALRQHNLKRLLAYSSIGQVGYLLLGFVVLSPLAASGVLFHLTGYVVNNLAAFCCLIVAYHHTQNEEMEAVAGLGQRAPAVALTLAAALFSLAGLPVFVGFVSKFYLFTAAAKGGLLWLVLLALLNSLVSLYYYLMVIKQAYLGHATEASPANDAISEPISATDRTPPQVALPIAGAAVQADGPEAVWRVGPTLQWLCLALFLAIVVLGVYPGPLVQAIEAVGRGLLGGS